MLQSLGWRSLMTIFTELQILAAYRFLAMFLLYARNPMKTCHVRRERVGWVLTMNELLQTSVT